MIEVEQKIPEFELPATQAGTLSNKDLEGKYAVIYFYPKDNTSVVPQKPTISVIYIKSSRI